MIDSSDIKRLRATIARSNKDNVTSILIDVPLGAIYWTVFPGRWGMIPAFFVWTLALAHGLILIEGLRRGRRLARLQDIVETHEWVNRWWTNW